MMLLIDCPGESHARLVPFGRVDTNRIKVRDHTSWWWHVVSKWPDGNLVAVPQPVNAVDAFARVDQRASFEVKQCVEQRVVAFKR